MRYTVLWTSAAEQELAAIWLGAEDRDAVTSAADSIDAMLRDEPQTRGESRYGALRIFLVEPLGVDFEIRPDDRIVSVLAVWHTGKKNRE